MPDWRCWRHSDVTIVDKTLFNVLIIKLVKFNCVKLYYICVAFNDRHASQRNGFRPTAGIYQKRSVASRFTWTMDYHVWGTMLEAYHKLHPKPKLITEVKEEVTLQVTWDSLPQNRLTRLLKASHCMTEEIHKSWRWTTSTQSDCQTSDTIIKYRYLKRKHCVVSMILFCGVSAHKFSAGENR